MFIDHPAPLIGSARLSGPEVLEIEFQAGKEHHYSRFAPGWLRIHAASAAMARPQPTVQCWPADMRNKLFRLSYADYMETNMGLRAFLQALQRDGIAMLQGVPTQSARLLEVANRVGPVRISNFGTYYDVISMPDPNASAYTDMGLELHTDLANWRMPPDIQLLACLQNSARGGDSVFADGFKVAEDLRHLNAQAYGLLTTQAIDFRFQDEKCDIRARAPVIETERSGGLLRMRFNNWLRSAMILPGDVIEPMYAALLAFWRLLREPRYQTQLRLAPGDLIAFDNNRVLHGRTAFDASSGERHLQGCYLNREDLESTLRVLARLE
jgi:gamma-butyrobetaine dioxygenase